MPRTSAAHAPCPSWRTSSSWMSPMKRCKLRAVALRQGSLQAPPLVVIPLPPPALSFFDKRLLGVPPDPFSFFHDSFRGQRG